MAASPAFASTPKMGSAALSAADTSRTAPTNVGTVLTAAASGTRVNRISIVATGTTTAGIVRLFLHDGANYRLWDEVLVSAITPSATVAAFTATLSDQTNIDILPLVLPTGWSLRATTEKAEAFGVIAHGADL